MADEINYPAEVGGYSRPGTTKLSPAILTLDLESGEIRAAFVGDNGVRYDAVWSDVAGENATAMILALNTANLTNNSLRKRLLAQALSDNKIPSGGAIS